MSKKKKTPAKPVKKTKVRKSRKVEIGKQLDSILVEVDPDKNYILFLEEGSMYREDLEFFGQVMQNRYPNVKVVCLVKNIKRLKLKTK